MKLYSENKNYKLYHGNMLDMLEVIKPSTVDSVVTDPPYELNFMGKGWDNSGIAFQSETWKKCYEVLKPGGYLLAFGGSRTFHRIACAIENAGFEIRDTIMWLYGSGFPKSLNISKTIEKREGIIEKSTETLFNNPNGKRDLSKRSDYGYVYKPTIDLAKQWKGWGTCLKPSFEPIIVARKPFKGSLVNNVIQYGVGGINVDECRIKYLNEKDKMGATPQGKCTSSMKDGSVPDIKAEGRKEFVRPELIGRFPANTILTYDENDFDEVCGGMPNPKTGSVSPHKNKSDGVCNFNTHKETTNYFNGDSGSASRYFYCAKASKKDRDEGLGNFIEKAKVFNGKSTTSSIDMKDVEKRFTTMGKNVHPTVKPTELMQYLIRLVNPDGATILDCFNGSGSTGKAVMYENKENNKHYKYIGIELMEEYLQISKARIEYVCNL